MPVEHASSPGAAMPKTSRMPGIVEALAGLPCRWAVIDGEVVPGRGRRLGLLRPASGTCSSPRALPSIFHVLSNANFGEIQERAYAFRDRHAYHWWSPFKL
jgi:hypothetical protein